MGLPVLVVNTRPVVDVVPWPLPRDLLSTADQIAARLRQGTGSDGAQVTMHHAVLVAARTGS